MLRVRDDARILLMHSAIFVRKPAPVAKACAISSVASYLFEAECAINLDAVVGRKENASGPCLNAAVELLGGN